MNPAGGTPRVSVLLPVRDGGPALADAVASILGQSLAALELLVIDDGSRDGAVQALPRDPRLRILPCAGRGIVAALNTGVAHARASLLARMDADDLALPARLERQVALLDARPEIGIVGSQVVIDGPQGPACGGLRRYQDWLNALTEPADIAREIYVESPLVHPSTLMRTALLRQLGGYRDTPWPEDYDLWLRAHAAGVRMAKCPEVLLHWRDGPQRLSRTDPRCQRRRLVEAKAHYLARGPLAGQQVALWGATPTGAWLCDALAADGVEVLGFFDLDPRKIGGRKRGRPVWPVAEAGARLPAAARVLVAVSDPRSRGRVRADLDALGRREGKDYWLAT